MRLSAARAALSGPWQPRTVPAIPPTWREPSQGDCARRLYAAEMAHLIPILQLGRDNALLVPTVSLAAQSLRHDRHR